MSHSNKSEEKSEVTLILFLAKLINSNQTNSRQVGIGVNIDDNDAVDFDYATSSSGYEGSSDDNYENSELELVERTINYIKILQKRLKVQKKTQKTERILKSS